MNSENKLSQNSQKRVTDKNTKQRLIDARIQNSSLIAP